jgi:two-component system cell cycle sensor histidine kinase PleC
LEAVSADEEADMTCRALSIPLGCRSPVGLAAATMRPEVIENARVSGAHLKPPLLMDTLSAVALPLIHEDTLLGVLELQSASPEVFGSAPPPVLVSLADQIAAVIRNAQIYEAQRQKAERLGESDQLRSHLLTVMSHKLRAPLNTIIGLSGALLDTDRDKLTDRQRRDIGLIHTLGRHLGELTDDLLDPPAGTPVPIELHREEVDLRLLVESAIHSVRPLLDSKGLEMKACLEADLPVIRADKRRVRQVLLRLLSRLAARTESGGIDVRARQTSALGAAGNEAELCVEVSVGVQGGTIHREVPMGSVPRIGADEHGHSDRNGSDRDLAIVEAVIAVHGGQFWAEGGPGDGTTYTFTLPLGQRD